MVRTWPAFLADGIMVCIFAAYGNHSHGGNISDFFAISWPYLAALCLAWLIPAVSESAFKIFPAGVLVWATTAIAGLLLRWGLTDRGISGTYPLVSSAFLLAALVGWRLVYLIVKRVRAN